nr:uncharacterized protein I203_03950 [Kwoniella mangroviensis CBS 8507]OCF67262.1 hypothetical protein I203_03950 [Kwoniella mangroviensis CBS 8507]
MSGATAQVYSRISEREDSSEYASESELEPEIHRLHPKFNWEINNITSATHTITTIISLELAKRSMEYYLGEKMDLSKSENGVANGKIVKGLSDHYYSEICSTLIIGEAIHQKFTDLIVNTTSPNPESGDGFPEMYRNLILQNPIIQCDDETETKEPSERSYNVSLALDRSWSQSMGVRIPVLDVSKETIQRYINERYVNAIGQPSMNESTLSDVD